MLLRAPSPRSTRLPLRLVGPSPIIRGQGNERRFRVSKETPAKEIQRLRDELRHHNYLYYVVGRTNISDQEYDRLFDRLVALEAEHPEQDDPNSPTRRVGGTPLDAFRTVKHRVPMLSMEKSYEAGDVRDWLERIQRRLPEEAFRFLVDPKIDGVAVGLRYERGELVLAVTRGDGVQGDDITNNVRTIGTIPLRLRGTPPEILEIRGEIYMTRAVFDSINQRIVGEGSEPYKNPRNLTAGSLKSLDSAVVAKRHLSFLMHGLGEIVGNELKQCSELYDAAESFGVPASKHRRLCASIDEVLSYIDDFAETRQAMDYDTDGVVVKVDDLGQQAQLGVRSRSPRWCMAFKYDTEQAETWLRAVNFQIGKTGAITPRATMEPVELAGTTVTHASLHNFDEIARKDIRLGDRIIVEKAGEIIPYVVRSLPERRSGEEQVIRPPNECPSCGAPTRRNENEVVLRCSNAACPARLRASLRHFASRRALDIEGLGEKLVDQLVDGALVKSSADLFRLSLEQLLPLERMGQRKAEKFLAALESSKAAGLGRLLNALNIPHVGESVAGMLAARYRSMAALRETDEESFAAAENLGPIMARELSAWFADLDNAALLDDLAALGLAMDEAGPELVTKEGESGLSETALAGLSVVVTGKLLRRTRDEIHALIAAAGGKASKSISKKTGLLVAGAKAGSKLAKAEKLGVEVISEDELYERIGLRLD